MLLNYLATTKFYKESNKKRQLYLASEKRMRIMRKEVVENLKFTRYTEAKSDREKQRIIDLTRLYG